MRSACVRGEERNRFPRWSRTASALPSHVVSTCTVRVQYCFLEWSINVILTQSSWPFYGSQNKTWPRPTIHSGGWDIIHKIREKISVSCVRVILLLITNKGRNVRSPGFCWLKSFFLTTNFLIGIRELDFQFWNYDSITCGRMVMANVIQWHEGQHN
jgi:hypothetical protein